MGHFLQSQVKKGHEKKSSDITIAGTFIKKNRYVSKALKNSFWGAIVYSFSQNMCQHLMFFFNIVEESITRAEVTVWYQSGM